MSAVVTGLHSPAKPVNETPEILGPGENRMRVPAEEGKKKKKDMDNKKKQQIPVAKAINVVVGVAAKKLVKQSQRQRQSTKFVVGSKKEDGSCSTTDSSSSDCSSLDGTPAPAPVVVQGLTTSKKKKVRNGASVQNAAKVVPVVGIQILKLSPEVPGPVKRCDWITPNSDPIYTKFHDEEWGVPVYDELKLLELFVLSQALSEHTWPTILNKRNIFRIMFDNFDPSSIASFDEKKLRSIMETKGNLLLSEPKLLAIVENAKQVLKIRKEFGSFSNYCWNFINHKPIRNGFKNARQVPAKTPKSELLSKDMMRRGFQRVGPTVVYSFIQVSGMANDHLISCFRYTICINNNNNNNNTSDDNKMKNRDLSAKACEETNAL